MTGFGARRAGGGGALQSVFDAGNIGVAYALRKINADYTGDCVRIREDGGDTETDIGFDANDAMDASAISSHIGANNGYKVSWYDQGSNSHTVSALADANEPLYSASDSNFNSKPVFTWDGSNDYLFKAAVSDTDVMNTDEGTLLAVINQNSASANNALFSIRNGNSNDDVINSLFDFGNICYWDYGGFGSDDRISGSSPSGWDNTTHIIECWRTTGSVQEIVIDGTQLVQGTSMTASRTTGWTGNMRIGDLQFQGGTLFSGEIVELVTCLTDIGPTVRAAWRSEVESYYGL